MAPDSPKELTIEDVRHVAALARVGVTQKDLEKMRGELSSILGTFQVLQEIDTDGIEPTGHAIAVTSVMRDDEPSESTPHDEILANAPKEQDGFFRVRAVLE